MKSILIIALLTYWAGCETTGPKKQPRYKRVYRNAPAIVSEPTSPVKGVGGIIEGNDTGILVSPAWMAAYLKRERKHGTIPADSLIWKEGENYRVNSEVINHFAKMKIDDNSLSP